MADFKFPVIHIKYRQLKRIPTNLMTTFTLEPQDNARLQSLCGAFDDHLKLIEKEFNLEISRNNFTFTIKSNEENPKPHHEKLSRSAVKLIQDLYLDTAPIKGKVKELDLQDVHMALQESRMLSHAWKAMFTTPQSKPSAV